MNWLWIARGLDPLNRHTTLHIVVQWDDNCPQAVRHMARTVCPDWREISLERRHQTHQSPGLYSIYIHHHTNRPQEMLYLPDEISFQTIIDATSQNFRRSCWDVMPRLPQSDDVLDEIDDYDRRHPLTKRFLTRFDEVSSAALYDPHL